MKNLGEVQDLRQQIDSVTQQLVQLVNKRAYLALEIGKAKKGQPIYDPAREAAVLAAVASNNPGPLSHQTMQTIFTEIIAACRTLQQPLRIAYLGPAGTYCQEAALQRYGEGGEYISCMTIDDIIRTVEANTADIAVVPVENSSEGSVNRTLDLLLQTPLIITGEIMLPIHHQLLTHAPSLEKVDEVLAHPQALAQCQAWLTGHLPSVVQTPAASNGTAAFAATKKKTVAAIASVQAAKQYNLPVLAESIEDNPRNTTRFLTLGTAPALLTGTDKTSLICSTPNQAGALRALLDIFADERINMIKLESRPTAHTLWQYIFYIDLEGHHADAAMNRALKKLQASPHFVKIVGSYPKAV